MEQFSINISLTFQIILIGLCLFLFARMVRLNQLIRQVKKQQENELTVKEREVSLVIEELRDTQLKLFESGKVSAVASLSAGILHQISQPITAIHGFSKFLKKEMNSNDVFYRPICLIDEQAAYLKQMLGNLMELVRHREIKKEDVNVNDPIMRSMNLLKDELRIRRINWDLKLGENLPAVFADTVHLQQVVMNIITNAIQVLGEMPRGAERYIEISSSFDSSAQQIIISIKDTGPGINLLDKMRIFEPFFSTKSKGAGIGLALCHDLVTEHGGVIIVESEPNQGANFLIRLPAAGHKASLPSGAKEGQSA